jgi:hypothetical protein
LYNNILTVIKPEMELGTVLHSESLDCQIGAREKPNSLHYRAKTKGYKISWNPWFIYHAEVVLLLTTGLSQGPGSVVPLIP